jgi:hypothetical protein
VTPDDAKEFLLPKWNVVARERNQFDTGTLLKLHTGQIVEIGDEGTFHVSGKGWQAINAQLQEGQWPKYARVQAREIKHRREQLGVTQLDYFNEGLNCIQFARAPRAAVVLGWSGFVDLLHQRFSRDPVAFNSLLRSYRPRLHSVLGDLQSPTDFEALKDKDAIELGFQMKLYDHHAKTQLDAMRDLRNACAHVGQDPADIQVALGFFSQLVRFLPSII